MRSANLDSVQLISASPQATADAGSARVKLTAKIGIGGDVHTLTMDGVLDLAHNAGAFTLDLGALTGQATSKTIEMRFVDGIMYVSIDALRGNIIGDLLPPDVKWVSFDLAKLAEQFGGDASSLGLGADPGLFTHALDSLRGAGTVTEIGPDTVGGVATTHYRVDLDLKKALENLPAEGRDAAEKGLDAALPRRDDSGRRMDRRRGPSAAHAVQHRRRNAWRRGRRRERQRLARRWSSPTSTRT